MNNSNLNVSKTVLVVEDEYLIRDTLRDALETEGYQVLLASNGQEALEVLAAASHPDLILLDMMMPVMGGVEFMKSVAADVRFAPIPILVVSASATSENTTGAKAFVRKPPDLEVLLTMVRKYIVS